MINPLHLHSDFLRFHLQMQRRFVEAMTAWTLESKQQFEYDE